MRAAGARAGETARARVRLMVKCRVVDAWRGRADFDHQRKAVAMRSERARSQPCPKRLGVKRCKATAVLRALLMKEP